MKWNLTKHPSLTGGAKQTDPTIETGTLSMSACSVIGNLVFLSGLNGIDLTTGRFQASKFEDQLVKCLENIRITLEKVGSSIENSVKFVILIKDIKDCPSYVGNYVELLSTPRRKLS